MKYKVIFPLTDWMSSCSEIVSDKPMETKEDEALWYYNKRREHDGLRHISRLPAGTVFQPIDN